MKKVLVIISTILLATSLLSGKELSENEKQSKCKKMVKEAILLIQKKGINQAVSEIENSKGKFIDGEFYVFVIQSDGLELVNPAIPALKGKNVIDLMDSNGKYIVREFISTALKHGTGWVDYIWPHKITKRMIKKNTYVEKVPGQDIIVCSGY